MPEEKESKYKRFIEVLDKNKDLIDKKFEEVNTPSDFPDYAKNHIEDFPGRPLMPGETPLANVPVGPGNFEFPPKIPDIKSVEEEFLKLLKKKGERK